jgi:uncharacterized protein (DUF305 family)
MIVGHPGRRQDAGVQPRPDGNGSDLRYLDEALAHLQSTTAACAAAARSSRPEVRALARAARSEQAARRSAIEGLLRQWGRPDTAQLRTTDEEALAGLEGDALDRAFVARLVACTRASITDARAEMIAGASRPARLCPRHAIQSGARQLSAVAGVLPASARDPDSPPVREASDRWRDDGGRPASR